MNNAFVTDSVGIAAWQADCCLGHNISTWPNQLQSHTHLLKRSTDWLTGQRSTYVGAITRPLPAIPPELSDLASRNVAVALALLEGMATQVQSLTQGMPLSRLGIVIGTSTSGLADNEKAIFAQHRQQPWPKDFSHAKQQMNATSVALQRYLGWQGPCFTISTACSSAAKAMLAGQRLLQAGVCDAVLVGGIDTLCHLAINGFDSLESLSADVCQPFGQHRDGINIGEGGGLFLLTPNPSAVRLLGGGESSDAWHISAPHPEGKGAIQAMQRALDQTHLQAADIDYINVHGTATPQNDAMEALAIEQVFGQHRPWLSSTKHQTGHCLGAAGAVEAAIACAILESGGQWLPWHQNHGMLDAGFEHLNFVQAQSNITQPIRTILSNSFAFAGSNVSLIFEASHA